MPIRACSRGTKAAPAHLQHNAALVRQRCLLLRRHAQNGIHNHSYREVRRRRCVAVGRQPQRAAYDFLDLALEQLIALSFCACKKRSSKLPDEQMPRPLVKKGSGATACRGCKCIHNEAAELGKPQQ